MMDTKTFNSPMIKNHTPAPLVSVVIPAYNAASYIGETIESVINQTYQNWELWIIDDGSKDNTETVVLPYLEKDSRIKYIKQKNTGVSGARNHGMSCANGEIIALLDADDVWTNTNLSEKIICFEVNPSISYVFSGYYKIDKNSNRIGNDFFKGSDEDVLTKRLLWLGEPVPGASSNLVFKRCVYDNGIRFDTNVSTGADVDFVISISSFYQGTYLDVPLWSYRILSNSMSRNMEVMDADFNYIYVKAFSIGSFDKWFKRRCFANLYLILAGSWWKNGNNKLKGVKYIIKAMFIYPPIVLRILKKVANLR